MSESLIRAIALATETPAEEVGEFKKRGPRKTAELFVKSQGRGFDIRGVSNAPVHRQDGGRRERRKKFLLSGLFSKAHTEAKLIPT
jgi:hypothetical protein